MQNEKKNVSKVTYIEIKSGQEGQRIDNFLLTVLKGVPKSHIYKILRKGEVRVNKRRIAASYKLNVDDILRLPPVKVAEKKSYTPTATMLKRLEDSILYEDDYFIILNKPAGMSVHGGNTVPVGIIEAFKILRPKLPQLELGHRLDTETSGCLVLVKKKRILREFHLLLREGKVNKFYWALTKGCWKIKDLRVATSLEKHFHEGGKHVVTVNPEGKTALTQFKVIQNYEEASLMEAKLYTGRTHQIRVHAASKGHPIAMDDRYGEATFNKQTKQMGLKRMFLHAHEIDFILPSLDQRIRVVAPLEAELDLVLNKFTNTHKANTND